MLCGVLFKMYRIEVEKEKIREIERKLGINILEELKKGGAKIAKIEEEKRRFIVLNRGAHDVAGSLIEQFGNVEIIYASEGNLSLSEVEEVAGKVAKMYKSEDVIVLTGPALLSVLSTLFSYVKSPDLVTVAQYDLSTGKYYTYKLSHLKIRGLLSE